MSLRASVLFVLLLVCSQGSASESRRQKRGIMKMMMHIMWDPVRLIRYWYAYDVTKEIAKSWRKILPTMMMLPFNPEAPGIAKYVHPTHGLRATKFHKNTKEFSYPVLPSEETHSASQYSKDYLISDPALKNTFSHFLPGSGIVFEGSQKQSESSHLESVPPLYHQYLNTGLRHGGEASRIPSLPIIAKEVDSSYEKQHHVILKPVPEGIFQSDASVQSIPTAESQEETYSGEMPFPFNIHLPNSRGEHVMLKAIREMNDPSNEKLESDVVPSSTNSNSQRTKNKYFQYPEAGQSYVRVRPNYRAKERDAHHVFHTGHQELHIVLHPIPIAPSNRGLHHVPLSLNASESSANGVLPGVSKPLLNTSPPGYDEEFYPSNNVSGHDEDVAVSSERPDGKSSGVTWVLKQDSTTDRRTDTKAFDIESDGSAPRLDSIHLQDATQQVLRLNGQSIDLVQLKEDLRHGTPVLIPFHKKTTFSSPQSDESPLTNHDNKSKESDENLLGQFDAKNSTQRLIFFFKRP